MKLFTFALAFTLAAFAQQHSLTNADVVHAVEQGSSTDAIIQSIKTARSVDFRISPEYTPQLEKAGVPKEIIDAMIRRVMDDEARSGYSSEPAVTKPIQPNPPKRKRGDAPSAQPEPAATPGMAQPVPQAITGAPPTQAAPTPGAPATAEAVSAGSTPTSLPATAATPQIPPHTESSPPPPSARQAAQQPAPRPVTSEKSNDTLTVTSIPDGATVEWNRKVIGKTPLTYQVGEYAFNARKTTVFSKRLLQPVVLRVSKEGYVSRDVTITQQMFWRSLNSKLAGSFFIITSNSFEINLDKISAAPAALTNADVIKLKAAGFGDDLIIDKINSNPAAFKLEFDDLKQLHDAGISDAIIQAMMHAK